MTDQPLRWGILGAARIARKNWQGIHQSGNSTVTAVASRDVARSRRLIAECQALRPMASVPDAYGSYEELLAAPNVDAVYIPLPTALRKAWVIRAAQAGKHVLCEKPCAPAAADLEEMLEACRLGGVQFMDGVMFDHSPRMAAMLTVLRDGTSIGAIRRITTAFTARPSDAFLATDIRTDGALEPLGCLGDLGWYCIRFILRAMDGRMPRAVSARLIGETSRAGARPVPLDFSAELLFEDGVSAGLSCSFSTALQHWVVVAGTIGQLKVSDFVVPAADAELTFSIVTAESRAEGLEQKTWWTTKRHVVDPHGDGHPATQEARMFRAFASQVRLGRLNEHWPEISLKTQKVTDACLAAALTAEAHHPSSI